MLNEALRIVRVVHGYKSVELAKELGISPSYLSEIETGKKTPSIDILEKYSDALDMKLSTLMFFSEELDKGRANSNIKWKMRDYVLKLMKSIEEHEELVHE